MYSYAYMHLRWPFNPPLGGVLPVQGHLGPRVPSLRPAGPVTSTKQPQGKVNVHNEPPNIALRRTVPIVARIEHWQGSCSTLRPSKVMSGHGHIKCTLFYAMTSPAEVTHDVIRHKRQPRGHAGEAPHVTSKGLACYKRTFYNVFPPWALRHFTLY